MVDTFPFVLDDITKERREFEYVDWLLVISHLSVCACVCLG